MAIWHWRLDRFSSRNIEHRIFFKKRQKFKELYREERKRPTKKQYVSTEIVEGFSGLLKKAFYFYCFYVDLKYRYKIPIFNAIFSNCQEDNFNNNRCKW